MAEAGPEKLVAQFAQFLQERNGGYLDDPYNEYGQYKKFDPDIALAYLKLPTNATSDAARPGEGLEDFTYDPIPTDKHFIRILKVTPDLECELILQDLASDHFRSFEALSWCWGLGKEDAVIRIRKPSNKPGKSGKLYSKPVKMDLVHALKALRNTRRDRYLWVDAVCINQSNPDEKNHQVEMMAEIYGKASRVCVWLGDADRSSQTALTFIRDEILKLQDFDDLCDRPRNSTKWKALLDLMQRPWFSRRWVVQEIALAQKALIYCGQDRISWRKFSIAVELFVEVETATHRLSEVIKKDRTFNHIPGWFDYVSQLGASLLVDATGKLFREHKTLEVGLPTRIRKSRNGNRLTESNSDDENLDDLSGDEDEDETEKDERFEPGPFTRSETIETDVEASPDSARSASKIGSSGGRAKKRLSGVKGQPLLGLEFLVCNLAIFNVSKTHDTIYALLAISRDTTPRATGSKNWENPTQAALEQFTQQKRYEVDYNKPYIDICQYFIEFCINRALRVDKSRALDVILRPWAASEREVKTWYEAEVDQWRDRKKKRIEAWQGQKGKKDAERSTFVVKANDHAETQNGDSSTETHAAYLGEDPSDPSPGEYVPLPSWVPQLSRAPFAMQRAAGVVGEKVGRTNADPLVGMPMTSMRSYSAAETKALDVRIFKFRKRLGVYSMFVKGFILDEINDTKDASQSGNIPSEWADFAGWERARGEPPDAFWRTLVGDRGKDGKNPPMYYARACKESFDKGGYLQGSINTSDLIRNERVSVIAQFCWRVQAVIWKRALAKTKAARLALVSPDTRAGDLVCILYGCSVPVIMRRNETKSTDRLEEEAHEELLYIQERMIACARRWCDRVKHYRKKREDAKAKYRVWYWSKRGEFYSKSLTWQRREAYKSADEVHARKQRQHTEDAAAQAHESGKPIPRAVLEKREPSILEDVSSRAASPGPNSERNEHASSSESQVAQNKKIYEEENLNGDPENTDQQAKIDKAQREKDLKTKLLRAQQAKDKATRRWPRAYLETSDAAVKHSNELEAWFLVYERESNFETWFRAEEEIYRMNRKEIRELQDVIETSEKQITDKTTTQAKSMQASQNPKGSALDRVNSANGEVDLEEARKRLTVYQTYQASHNWDKLPPHMAAYYTPRHDEFDGVLPTDKMKLSKEEAITRPNVHWRQFELRLMYWRRWRKLLTKHRDTVREKAEQLLRDERKALGWTIFEKPPSQMSNFETVDIARQKKRWGLKLDEVPLDSKSLPSTRPKHNKDLGTSGRGFLVLGQKHLFHLHWEVEEWTSTAHVELHEESKTIVRQAWLDRVKTWLQNTCPNSYTLLGDCYLHGMMDGEAMAEQNRQADRDDKKAVVFEIR